MKNGKFTYPTKEFTDLFAKALKEKKLDYFRGVTWTTDAPYRETITEVKKYSKEGIMTVEMEASALFAIANYRKVKIASAFVVSDLLGKKWLPKFHRFDVKKAQNKLIDAAIYFLNNP